MHDGELEDRLRAVLRAEGDALPLTITTSELERRLALRRRDRLGRRMSFMAAGVAVIVLGSLVATTAGWIPMPRVGFGPEASTEPHQTPYQSLGPAATPLAGVSPLIATPGRAELIRIDPAGPIDQVDGTATASTETSATSVIASISCVGSGRLDMAINGMSQGMGCAADLSLSPNVWFDVEGGQVSLTYTATGAVSFAILVERPGEGEAPPTGDEPHCEQVDPSIWPEPPSIGAGVSPGDTLRYSGVTSAYEWGDRAFDDSASWVDVPTELQIVVFPEVEHFVVDGILVADGVVTRNCLYEVRAEAILTNTSQAAPSPLRLAVEHGIGTSSVEIEPPPVGVWLVKVRASFATMDGSPAWSETTFRVIVRFDAPSLTVEPDFLEVMAEPGCPSYQLTSGASAADSCGAPYELIEGRDPIAVRSGDRVAFRLTDDWLLDEARTVAVDAELVARGEFTPEYSVDFQESVGRTLTFPIVLDPGSWILRISLNGHRGGDTFGAYYDLAVTVTP